jgi:hypothetical protein
MKDKSKAMIRKLQAEGAQIAKRRGRIDGRALQLADDEKKYQERLEVVILGELRSSGVMKLPLATVLEGIRALGQAAGMNGIGSQQANLNGGDRPRDGSLSDARESKPEVHGSDYRKDVFVKLTRNASVANRAVLGQCGLRWKSNQGGWRGRVGNAALELLEKTFEGRLTILSEVTPAPEASGSATQPAEADTRIGQGVEVASQTDAKPPSVAAPAKDLASTTGAADDSTLDPVAEPDALSDTAGVPKDNDNSDTSRPSVPLSAPLPKSPFASFVRRPPVNR